MTSLMLKKDGMILEKLISAKGFPEPYANMFANSLIISRMLRISLNLQQS